MTRTAAPPVHPTAVISGEARLAPDVRVGPFAVIDGPVTIGPGCVLGPHVHLMGPLTLGANNTIGTGTVLGGPPQHLAYRGEVTAVEIGNGNTFHEHVTVHRAMPVGAGSGTGVTRIGNDNYFMAGSHVAHDCRVGNHTILVNAAVLGGHVELGDRAMISGNSAVHQFCRVGRVAMLAGVSACTRDIPPFWILQDINRVFGVNVVGMRRASIPPVEIQAVRKAFRIFHREKLTIAAALLRVEAELGQVPAVREVIDFIRTTKRGICGGHRVGPHGDHVAA